MFPMDWRSADLSKRIFGHVDETQGGEGKYSMTGEALFVLDQIDLDGMAKKYREAYAKAKPFPHVVIDNFLPPRALKSIADEFPAPAQIDWTRFDNPAELKLATKRENQMGERTRLLMHQFNSSCFLGFLEALSGICGLIPDPHFWGGGLHQIQRGGFLKVHADFNRHPHLALDRRINVLLYLNEDWKEEYGGHLELWTADMTKCGARILPVFNRCVVFSTTDYSFHGHPDPLTCPLGVARRSIALYYYSNGRPQEELSGSHNTLFRQRPGEVFLPDLQSLPQSPSRKGLFSLLRTRGKVTRK